ncbi:MAG: PIN domain-containing protein [Pseudomonadota bacterium]
MTGVDLAVDTSIAIALLVASHEAHSVVLEALRDKRLALPSHALVETYSVLTRLPGDARVDLADAVRLLDENFPVVLAPRPETMLHVHSLCAELGIGGGAIYDAIVALAARDHSVGLVTRDKRAESTYKSLAVTYSIVAGAAAR